MLTKIDLTGIALVGAIVIESVALTTGHDGQLLLGTLAFLAAGGGFGAGYATGLKKRGK